MLRFVELCVNLRKGKTAKEGLHQYKNISQNTSVATIEVSGLTCFQLAVGKYLHIANFDDFVYRIITLSTAKFLHCISFL